MSFPDLISVLQWWTTVFIIGIIFIPITNLIFSVFLDRGYVFAKIIGIAFISYCVFIFGFSKVLAFETQNILLIAGIFVLINFFIFKKTKLSLEIAKFPFSLVIFEEALFLIILVFWSFVHAHAPDIHGLEKYMDFGFINSILRAKYFPPLDMWFTPYSINYYYFGHLTTAVLTRLSFLPSELTFNLMLSTVAAIGFTSAFSITINLLSLLYKKINFKISIIGGLLTAFLLNFAGNLHIIYLFFKPYENENPVPFWQQTFSPLTFLQNSYWYPNATRFIHNTIHEFPIYSHVVSDLHGHVLDIPFVLLTIAVLLSIFFRSESTIKNCKFEIILLGFLLAIMYMTNAWDGIIYLLLALIIILVIQFKSKTNSIIKNLKSYLSQIAKSPSSALKILWPILTIIFGFFIFSLPFDISFKPFASGIGILCAPKFLTDIGTFGPILFEVDHCQHSPLWQLAILYGFFYFWAISFVIFIFKKCKSKHFQITSSDIFIIILIILSTFLIIIPEFIYVKDIYPAHYRANTMFKLAYQAFIMLSLSSGYIIIRLFLDYRSFPPDRSLLKLIYWVVGITMITIIFFYPYLAINSYFGDLKTYYGLNGTKYLSALYPDDYNAIQWINKNIKGQPIMLEAQGDSYTDYARVSSNTGLPTVLGWTVHEWLWRGSYDVPAPRIQEIEKMYQSEDIDETKILLKKYNVAFVFIGRLEHEKYPTLNERKFQSMGNVVYQDGNTEIFRINTTSNRFPL